jgi:hypothetical protein
MGMASVAKRGHPSLHAGRTAALCHPTIAAATESTCTPRCHPLYLAGIEQFNRQGYFESHELWEALWKGEAGPARSFYKGLIQAAVALHHLTNGNAHGARKLLSGAQRHLEPYRPHYLGLDVDRFLAAMNRCCDNALAGCGPTILLSLLPRIELQPLSDGASAIGEKS